VNELRRADTIALESPKTLKNGDSINPFFSVFIGF
jgi:hypothetical protein